MKRFKVFAIIFLFLITACSKKESHEFDPENIISNEEFLNHVASPGTKDSLGKSVSFGAQIFNIVQKDDEYIYYQAYINPAQLDKQVMVFIPLETPQLNEGEFVLVDGIINSEFLAESETGNLISALAIRAVNVEKSSFKDAVAPSLKTIEVSETLNHQDISVTLEKLEFSEFDTRIFVEITNNSDETISIFSHDFKLMQDDLTYSKADHFVLDYPEFDHRLKPKEKTFGIQSYAFMDYENIPSIKLEIKGIHSDHQKIDDFVFEVKISD